MKTFDEFKDFVTMPYYNSSTAISSGAIVPIGSSPNIIGCIAVGDIAASSWGVVAFRGTKTLQPDTGNGGALGAAYYRSGSTNGITTTGTSVSCFLGYGASSILSTDASGRGVDVVLDGWARPRGES